MKRTRLPTFPQFNLLPIELQNEILKDNLSESIRLSRRYPSQLSNIICSQPVSETEFSNYLNFHPLIVGTFEIMVDGPNESIDTTFRSNYYTLKSLYNYNNLYQLTSFETDLHTMNDRYVLETETEENVTRDEIITTTSLDLLTLYRILKRRLPCQGNANYAKEYVIKEYQKQLRKLLMAANKYPHHLLHLFGYLRFHAYIFNLPLLNVPGNIDSDTPQIKQLIPELIQQIQQRLNTIDIID